MTCKVLQTDRTILGCDGSTVVETKSLGFVPVLMVIDNMSDAECRVYDGAFVNPVKTGAPPLDVIPPRGFKIVVYTGQSSRFTLAVETGSTFGQFVNWILTEDRAYADSYHQQINPVNVEVRIAASKELLAGSVAVDVTPDAITAVATPVSEVTIQNAAASTGDILVGGAAAQVMEVKPGGWITLPVANLNLIFLKTASGTATANWLARR